MKYKSVSIWLGWLLALLLAACEGEAPGEAQKAQLIFKMGLPPALEVETRATASLADIPIEDVWVVQYNAGTNGFLNKKCFTGEWKLDSQKGLLEINTSEAEFSLITSRFYVIVNAGSTFLENFTGTEAELKKKTVDAPDITGELGLLTSGPIKYTPTGNGNVVVITSLTRAYAKVSVEWKDTDKQGEIKITGMDVYNLPNKMAFYTRGGGNLDGTYPEGTDITTDSKAAPADGTGQTYCFYMPENLRGMGTASSFADKGLKKYGPGGTLDNCTYVVLKGTYSYKDYLSDGTNASGSSATIDVEYHIYLGGNLIKDYNIQRGYWYQVVLNFSGANTGDIRVRITDGKVTVFEQVKEITHKLEI